MINKVILACLLIIGFILHLLVTQNGNFLFNMDNARDMVDVREMVELKKWRLIGPTSGIEGVYDGPAWYYLMVPFFVFSNGNPYSMIVLECLLWVIGAIFLFKLMSRYGNLSLFITGLIWIFSDLTMLATQHSLSPNGVLLLMPVLFWCLEKSLKNHQKINWYSLVSWILAGLFFNFEMAYAVFLPILIIAITFIYDHKFYLRATNWVGILIWSLFLLPQILFDLKHNHIMSQAFISYLQSNHDQSFGLSLRFTTLVSFWQSTISGLLFNSRLLIDLFWLINIVGLVYLTARRLILKNHLLVIGLAFFGLPFLLYLIVPLNVMLWHLLTIGLAFLIIAGATLNQIQNFRFGGLVIVCLIFLIGKIAITDYQNQFNAHQHDQSSFKNELAAVDYVYSQAQGQNFKVYTFLPSVIDYPYQYLFWWRGLNKFSYTPVDYAYLPNKPEYINLKASFTHPNQTKVRSEIYLVEESGRPDLRDLWLNSFRNLSVVNQIMIGPIQVETRQGLSAGN